MLWIRIGYDFLYWLKRAFGARRAAGGAGAPSSRTHPLLGHRHHSSLRPDLERFARRRPASRALSVATRWPPATLDPGPPPSKRAGYRVGGSIPGRPVGAHPARTPELACRCSRRTPMQPRPTSAAGTRARPSQREGQGFESPQLHQIETLSHLQERRRRERDFLVVIPRSSPPRAPPAPPGRVQAVQSGTVRRRSEVVQVDVRGGDRRTSADERTSG